MWEDKDQNKLIWNGTKDQNKAIMVSVRVRPLLAIQSTKQLIIPILGLAFQMDRNYQCKINQVKAKADDGFKGNLICQSI